MISLNIHRPSVIEQATDKSQAEINSGLRLAVSKNEHLLVSVRLTLGRGDPNAQDDECSIEGTTLHSPVKFTKDLRMLKLLLIHGAKIDTASTHPWYHSLMRGRGGCGGPLERLRGRFGGGSELNHSKGRGAEHQLIMNTSSIRKGPILAWLSNLEPEKDHDRIYSKRHENTGQWFLDSAEVGKWIGGPEMSLLWCYGNRGWPEEYSESLFSC